MSMNEALQAFVSEALDLLEQMEDALLQMEQRPGDAEAINAIFRAAHTIKGSAGIFGLDHIVGFTHVVESVLDDVRAGEAPMTPALSSLLLRCGDHVRDLVKLVAVGEEPDAECKVLSAALTADLNVLLARDVQALHLPSAPRPAHDAGGAPPASASEGEGEAVGADHWHLSLRFGLETVRNGFDPLSFVRYLETFGEIVALETLVDEVPPLSRLEPDDCHLGFEIAFRTDADKGRIEAAFDFVRDGSRIRLVAPHSKLQEYVALIGDLPDGDARLGEMLVRCGSLTPAELEAALDTQTAQACIGLPVERLGQLLVHQGQVAGAVVDAALAKQGRARDGHESSMLRVDAAKLDHLINLVGELIIAGAGAALVARKHRVKELTQANEAVSRLMEEVRDSALTLRMVQIGGTFNRFQRVVRDVSLELGKDIQLKISGGETELDKAVVERLADPLTHLVRNAMDHGIESADERVAAGKPAQGTVGLHACHEAGWVVVEVSDDGRGLDKERILRKGIQNGLVAADATLADQEIFQLIFQPGFSTAEQVSSLSGRGVGMDVVKRGIADLRGSVEIRTEPGTGTTIRVRLPLTLAIIDGFLLGVGKAAYVVPLGMVVECLELSRQEADGRDWIDLRGEVLPLIHLRELFAAEGDPGRRQNVVVVNGGGIRFGLVVDHLMGELQTVIKPLGRVFRHVQGIGGFTILGTGAVALLLDVPNLVKQVVARDRVVTGAARAEQANPNKSEQQALVSG